MVIGPQKVQPSDDHLVIQSEPLIMGIVNRFKAQYIPDKAASELNNNDLEDPTRPSRRDGFAATADPVAAAKRIAAAVNYYPVASANRRVYVAVNGDDIYGTADMVTWTAVTGGPFDVGTDTAVLFAIADGVYVIPINGTAVQVIDNTGAIAASTNTNADPPTTGVDGFFGLARAWILGSDGILYFSKINPSVASVTTDWCRDGSCSGVGGRFIMSPYRGGKPVACTLWQDQSVMVFYDRYIEECVVSDMTTGSYNLQTQAVRRVIEPDYGTPAKGSVVKVGRELYFLDQYGEFRALTKNLTGSQAGIVSKPISEPIKEILPGMLNKSAISKVQAIAFKDKIYVRFPLNTYSSGSESIGEVVLDLGLTQITGSPVWTAFNVYPRSTGYLFVSQLRSGANGAEELFFTDGGNGSSAPFDKVVRVYRMFPQTYKDNGTTAIPWQHTTKAFDCSVPHLDKILDTVEVEVFGDSGCSMHVDVQVDEDGLWEELAETADIAAGGGSYPLTYPITYPITDNPLGLTRKAISVSPQLSEVGRGRTHRFRFRETTSGKRFQLCRWHATLRMLPHERGT